MSEAKKGTRIYIVTNHIGAPIALVRARSKAAAVNRVVKRDYRADVAEQDELVELVGNGWRVLDADDDADEPSDGAGNGAGADGVTLSPQIGE